jgi:hypothetical protein
LGSPGLTTPAGDRVHQGASHREGHPSGSGKLRPVQPPGRPLGLKLPLEIVGVVIGGLQALVEFSDLGVQRSCPLISELDRVLN